MTLEHDRYYIDGKPAADTVELSREESHHLIHVRRGMRGDAVTLFDGLGMEYSAEIAAVRKTAVTLRIISARAVSRELACRITLAFAPPKSHADGIIAAATELGAAVIQPIYTERTLVRYKDLPRKAEKWRRAIIEACKQCGRNLLPRINPPAEFNHYLAANRANLMLLAHPAPDAQTVTAILAAKPASVILLVGPEGGYTDEEVQAASANGAHIVTLGPSRLRAETAALALLAQAAAYLIRA